MQSRKVSFEKKKVRWISFRPFLSWLLPNFANSFTEITAHLNYSSLFLSLTVSGKRWLSPSAQELNLKSKPIAPPSTMVVKRRKKLHEKPKSVRHASVQALGLSRNEKFDPRVRDTAISHLYARYTYSSVWILKQRRRFTPSARFYDSSSLELRPPVIFRFFFPFFVVDTPAVFNINDRKS